MPRMPGSSCWNYNSKGEAEIYRVKSHKMCEEEGLAINTLSPFKTTSVNGFLFVEFLGVNRATGASGLTLSGAAQQKQKQKPLCGGLKRP